MLLKSHKLLAVTGEGLWEMFLSPNTFRPQGPLVKVVHRIGLKREDLSVLRLLQM
jgi:hypothetical protein